MTVAISNEPKTGKPRNLNISIGNLTISYSTDLMDTDGSTILKGANTNFQLTPFPNQGDTTEIQAAKEVLSNSVAVAFEAYFNAIGN